MSWMRKRLLLSFYQTTKANSVVDHYNISQMTSDGGSTLNSRDVPEIHRPFAYFSPSIWGDFFIYSDQDVKLYEDMNAYSMEIEVLREEVRKILMDSTTKPAGKMNLINSLDRLGVSYHFEKEIEEQLTALFSDRELDDGKEDDDNNLYDTAVRFRIFRQHGHKISCEVFNKFTNGNGKFKKILERDVRGMLSLYEASQLSIRGEYILDEAFAFTSAHLASMAPNLGPPLSTQVKQALTRPLHRCIPRLEARQFISAYEEEQSKNEVILRFAKVDFNKLQLQHQQELRHISKWWKDKIYSSNISDYARDRVVECYFWILGVYFEPQYSLARYITSKVLAMVSILDDTYDAYGTIEELRPLTEAINRWDATADDRLPDSMKTIYRTLLSTFNDIDEQMAKEKIPHAIFYAKEAMKELVGCYHVEAEWFNRGYTPTFDEYMENGYGSSTIGATTLASLLGMTDIVHESAFKWLLTLPKILKASERIGRLLDDIASHEFEHKRPHVASAVDCYMKEFGVTEVVAVGELKKIIENSWKDMNEESLKPTAVSFHVLMRILNLARMSDVCYRYGDGYTFPELLKDYVQSLMIKPLPI